MSLRRNILTTGFVKVFVRVAIGFASSLISVRWLGPEGLGLYTTFMVVPLILKSIGELGVRQSAAYMTGKKLAAETQIVGALAALWLLSSAFSVALVLTAYYVQGLYTQSVTCVLIGLSLAPAGLIARYANGIALGRQWISKLNIGETLQAVTRVGLLAGLLIGLRLGVPGALMAESAAALAPGLLMLYWIKRSVVTTFVPFWEKKLILALLTHGAKFAMAVFLISLNYKINVLILQRFVSNAEIGQFGLGVKIAELIWMIPTAVSVVLFSHSTAAGGSARFAHTVTRIMRLTLLVCGICAVCIGVLCKPFVVFVFGPQFLPSVPVIRVILPGCVSFVVFKVLRSHLSGQGYPLAGISICLGTLGLNALLNIILVPTCGLVASAAASSISYIVGAIGFAWFYSRRNDVGLMSMFYQPVNDWQKLKATILTMVLKFAKGGA